ncbi:hypothetical protein EJ377_04795 [Chryseobacterium arthrosphaerae]|uniref:Glycosyl hydrolase family 92 domain-containing protein n=1 Tax=Chryseobacterium arthrosphaerae TaxID=651561 RepID=A0A3S0N8G0_9FLAO|nr:hypothetical protein EJ377_04795 [Chryseobacterium arthrosphaerae]
MALFLLCAAGYSGLIAAHGGKESLNSSLMRSLPHRTNNGQRAGRYYRINGPICPGNEPSHHIAYLYNFVDKPEKQTSRLNTSLIISIKILRTD